MSEVIDDKVDKFHEALLKRYSKKTLAAAIIFVALFCSWFVYATYREYDFWTGVGNMHENWQLIREIEVVNCIVTKFNISMTTNMGFFLAQGFNSTEMAYTINRTYENGTTYYWQVAILADAEFEELYHLKDLLGHRLSETPLGHYRMSFHCYPLLFRFLSADYNTTDTMETDNLLQLRVIALNRFAKLYHELMQFEDKRKIVLLFGVVYEQP